MSSSKVIPHNWVTCTLGEVVNYGVTQKVAPNEIPDDAWLLELEDIEKDTSKLLKRVKFRERYSKSTKNAFHKGDILYGKLRPNLNKVLIADDDGFCSTEILPISVPDFLDNRYLFYWLRHPDFVEYATETSHGLNMPRLGTNAGINAPFILCPLVEQRLIADKLDSIFNQIEACRARLTKILPLIHEFRQAVLEEATSGRLSIDFTADGTADWKYERAVDICDKVQSGGTPKEGFLQYGDVPFLKVYNIVNQKVAFDYKPQYVTNALHTGSLKKSVALPGDVLMNIVGPPLGKVAIIPNTYPEWNINQALTIFRPSQYIISGWLYYVLCTKKYIETFKQDTRGSAGQINISLSQCRDFILPVPPLSEQEEIVRRLDALFLYAQSAEDKYHASYKSVEGSIPAILRKAFSGSLLPKSSYNINEDATQLLNRIASSKSRITKNLLEKKVVEVKPIVVQKSMSIEKPAKTLGELVQRLKGLGGQASPLQLLVESKLETDIDLYFELLKEGRDSDVILVPVGNDNLITAK